MFNYQKEVLNKTGNHTLICNWARCLGKTYTIMATILETKPKYVLYVDFNLNNLQVLKNRFDNIMNIQQELRCEIKEFSYTEDKIEITYYDGNVVTIYNYYSIPIEFQLPEFNYIFFNEILPTPLKNVKSKRVVSFITTNNHDHHLEKLYGKNNATILNEDYFVGLENNLINESLLEKFKNGSKKDWYEQFAIMDDPLDINVIDHNVEKELDIWKEKYEIPYHMEFNIRTLLKLQNEYNNIPEGSNTTKTRESLLSMINRLRMDMKLNEKEISTKPMYVDYVHLKDKGYVKASIYVDNRMIILDSKFYKTSEDIAEAIYKLAKYNKYTVFIDTHGFGKIIYDQLVQYTDLKVKELHYM